MERKMMIYGSVKPKTILIQCVDEHDIKGLENEYQYIKDNFNRAKINKRNINLENGNPDNADIDNSIMLVAIKVNDWNSELSPWYSPAVFGENDFKGNAATTLKYIEKELIPDLKSKYGDGDSTRFVIGGYSLAGLFALWCGYQSVQFYGVVAASPSVWFTGWIKFTRENHFQAEKVYLSLGDKEEKTRNKVMAAVGDNIREQFQLFQNENIDCTLEWNEGNHFKDTDIRMGKAFVCILSQ